MMKIRHKIPKLTVESEDGGNDDPVCILSNRKGGFLFLSEPVISKYNGFFVNYNMEIFKVLQDIRLADSSFHTVENGLTYYRRVHEGNSEKIFCPEGINGFSYSLAKKARVVLDFDCKRIDDMRSFGMNYDVDVGKGRIMVDFTKRTAGTEDDTDGVEEFGLCIAMKAGSFLPERDYEYINSWNESYYSYDYSRKDFPAHRYVYQPFILTAKSLLVAVGRDRKEALAELEKMKKVKEDSFSFSKVDAKKDREVAAAFVCAQNSLERMKVHHDGVDRLYAGLPWFFQFWSRDENISLGGLIAQGQFKEVKGILFSYLENISEDGRLPNHIPSPHLGSSDGVGWFWKRVGDLIHALESAGNKEKMLPKKDMDLIRKKLEISVERIEKNYRKEGLIFSDRKETWIDTDYNGQDGREGFPVEIQALHLNMLKLLHELGGEKKYASREKRMRKKVLERFWNGSMLADRADDYMIRPNIFIAYYVYPDLLSRREWQTAFENVLGRLWLDWGGLSTIDKQHFLFVNEYTGKDCQSYHRGDSWFWLNSLAALCMFRNNPIEFEDRIRKVLSASAKEILWMGAVGHNAEVSSASHLSSYGCFAQAWSDALFIELVSEVYGVGK